VGGIGQASVAPLLGALALSLNSGVSSGARSSLIHEENIKIADRNRVAEIRDKTIRLMWADGPLERRGREASGAGRRLPAFGYTYKPMTSFRTM